MLKEKHQNLLKRQDSNYMSLFFTKMIYTWTNVFIFLLFYKQMSVILKTFYRKILFQFYIFKKFSID